MYEYRGKTCILSIIRAVKVRLQYKFLRHYIRDWLKNSFGKIPLRTCSAIHLWFAKVISLKFVRDFFGFFFGNFFEIPSVFLIILLAISLDTGRFFLAFSSASILWISSAVALKFVLQLHWKLENLGFRKIITTEKQPVKILKVEKNSHKTCWMIFQKALLEKIPK